MSRVLIILCLLPTVCFNICYAQNKSDLGSIKGIVRDTAHNYVLQSATVSIYHASKLDSNLINYQITNTYGEFTLTNLPLGVPLRIQISNVGYTNLNRAVTIPLDTKSINLNTLILTEKSNTLREVVIEVPPVIMNGDTLEFNSSAFKLDTNAVVEDLLRKIPNVTMWGDGKITVNGREVKSLLVNGKQFFDGNFKIATQNIAKNALEKVQIYKTATSQSNPLDSTIEMNLKLKKDKRFGYFGKLGIGYGSNGRYELDASLSFFNEKMQVMVVGALNNINKIASDVQTLTNSSTFKGIGANIDYRPDFSRSGITRPRSFGTTFTYNFIDKPNYYNKSTLDLNYFRLASNNSTTSNLQTTTTISDNSKVIEANLNKKNSDSVSNKFDARYEWVKRHHSLTIKQSASLNHNEMTDEFFRNSLSDNNAVTSANNSINREQIGTNIYDIAINYRMGENKESFSKKFKGFSVTYMLNVFDEKSKKLNQAEFKSFLDPSLDKELDRRYYTKSQIINQQFNLELTKIKKMLFGDKNLFGLDLTLSNGLSLNNGNSTQLIEDFEPISANYERNSYLTNTLKSQIIEESPGASLVKLISNDLANRFTKSWSFELTARQKIIFQDNQSGKLFQNIKRSYSRFAPEATIQFTENLYSEHYRRFSLKFNTLIRIPTLEQLAPLVDSANLYDVRFGNVKLKESRTNVISLSFLHEDQSTKNTLNYGVDINAGVIKNNIIDSTSIADDNRRITYLTNSNGNKYLSVKGNIRKGIKLKHSELQLEIVNGTNLFKGSSYVNGVFTFLNNLSNQTKFSINYTFAGNLSVEAIQSYLTYKSKQVAFNTQYSGVNIASTLSSSYNLNKRMSLSSNITLNNSTSSTNTNSINFTIWNASGIYRVLKGNNLEFKLSVLDILHQNNSVINYGSPNSFTVGTQNVLQNYFMATISYYPRQFGKKKK